MDPIVVPFLGATAVAVGAYFVTNVRAHRRCRSAWREGAGGCGLQDVRMWGLAGFVGTARSGSFTLRVEPSIAAGVTALRVKLQTVTDRIGLVKPHVPAGSTLVATSNEDIEIGEPRLDTRLIITGEPLAVHALLDAETRALLIRLVECPLLLTLSLSGGTLSFLAETPRFGETLGLVLRVAERLAEVPPVEERVEALAGGDPLPSVRLTCLHALMEQRPRHPATRSALRAALSDPHPSVRLSAALTLRTEGREALLRLARSPDTTSEVASRAVVALGAHFPPDDAARTLETALRSGRFETVGACLDSLASRGAAHLEPVRRVLDGPSDTGAALAASALGLSSAAQAEPMLLLALERHSREVRAAAIRSLGRIGSAASVPLLRELEPTGDAAFRRAVREAVASIQSRLVGAGQGQLALTTDGGALSLTDDAGGRVTLPDVEPR
jgi:HEAT repeat protein